MSILSNTLIFNGGGTARLPKEYQEVTYIQTDGVAYIDTGYKPNQPTIIKMHVYRPDGSGGYTWNLFGIAEDSGKKRCMVSTSTSQQLTAYGTGSSGYISAMINYSTFSSSIDMRRQWLDLTAAWNPYRSAQPIVMIDATNGYFQTATSGTEVGATFTGSAYFLGQNYNGTARSSNGQRGQLLEIYTGSSTSFKLDEFTLANQFISCYRKSDNEPGMYDLVNNVLHTNAAGSGAFTIGAEVIY